MELRESTARTRELGLELRRIRESARYSAAELARKLGWSQSKVSRMESGSRGISEVDAAVFLAFCGVVGKELNRLVDLTRESDDSFWLHARGERLPDELRSLISQETTAQVITYYEPLVIPGLVQTEDYARALFREGNVFPTNIIEARIRVRLERQQVLHRQQPPRVVFYAHENALRAPVGGDQVMHEQMLHLLLLCAAPPCTVRVVPASRSGVASIGPFTYMAHAQHNPVIYTEQLTSSLFLEGNDNVTAYRRILDRLMELALDEGESRQFLATLASEYDRPEEGGS